MNQIKTEISRGESELLQFFRSMSTEQQLEILRAAEATYDTQRRLGELASRNTEKGSAEDAVRH